MQPVVRLASGGSFVAANLIIPIRPVVVAVKVAGAPSLTVPSGVACLGAKWAPSSTIRSIQLRAVVLATTTTSVSRRNSIQYNTLGRCLYKKRNS